MSSSFLEVIVKMYPKYSELVMKWWQSGATADGIQPK